MVHSKKEPKAVVREFWERMQTNDFAFATELFSDLYTLDWPQSNERITGKCDFITINNEYPVRGIWSFKINQLVGDTSTVVSDVSISDDNINVKAITFSTVLEGKIIRQVEYWPDNYPSPENRKHLVKPILK